LFNAERGFVMSKQEDIVALRKEIEKKERDLYRANKEISSWNSGKHQSHSNAKMSKLFVESSRKEIAGLHARLNQMKKEA
jgi:hypothetical protein